MSTSAQTTERLALGWVLVRPAEGSPYYAQPRTQKTQYDEPDELRHLRQLSLDLVDTAEAGTSEDIENLLSQGADVNAQDPAGVTPVMKAVMFNNTDALARLLEEAPDLSVRDTAYGRVPLLWAAFWGHCVGDPPGGSVGMLIRAGANPDDVDNAGKHAMDLCCLALDGQPEVRVERLPILERLLRLLKIWREVRSSKDAITKLVRRGNFGAAAQKVEETLATIADVLATDLLSESERPEFEAMQHTLQGWRGWCEFGAKRRNVERQLAQVQLLPTETLEEVNDALAQADAALLAYEEMTEECHSWPTNSDEDWRDVEAAGVAGGLEASEQLRTSLHAEHLRLEKEHSAELKKLAADKARASANERQRKAAEQLAADQLRRQDKQSRSDQALKEARLRRLAREKAIADETRRAEAERTAQEKEESERRQREEEAAFQDLQERLQGPRMSSVSARRLQVKKQQRLKDQHRRFAKAKAAVRLVGGVALKRIEHERDKIIYYAALASEDIAETNRLHEDLIWQSSPDEWQCAVELAVAATERYKSALAALLKTPSALSENAAMELMKAAEAAHEVADVLEEEAQMAEDKRAAHNAVMNATGDLRAHVVQQIGSGASTMVFGADGNTKQQPLDLDKVAQVLQQSEGRAPQTLKPRRAGIAGNTPDSSRLGAQLSAKVAQHQTDHESTQNEAILRAQKSARRRIVEEVHRKAAVSQLVRTTDAEFADDGQLLQSHSTGGRPAFGDSMASNTSIPDWIDEADGKPNTTAITFVSPRQINLQTESEYMRLQQEQQQQELAAANDRKDESQSKAVTTRTQLPDRIGIQDTCSTRSFPAMLPKDMPAALYLTMQQREADRAAKEQERQAREQGWRANMQVDPTPPEKRVYMYGDVEIRVGGRGSTIVDMAVSDIRNHKKEQEMARGGSTESPTQPATGWERSVHNMMSTPGRTANRSSSNLSASAGRRGNAATIEQRGMPTDSDLDR